MTEATDPVATLVAKVRARGGAMEPDPRRELPEPSERLRIRLRAGVTLQQIADALGVAVTTAWNWENGQDGPSRENAARYGDLLSQLDEAMQAAS